MDRRLFFEQLRFLLLQFFVCRWPGGRPGAETPENSITENGRKLCSRRSAGRRDAREQYHREWKKAMQQRATKEPKGGSPQTPRGENTKRGETAHRGTPPAKMDYQPALCVSRVYLTLYCGNYTHCSFTQSTRSAGDHTHTVGNHSDRPIRSSELRTSRSKQAQIVLVVCIVHTISPSPFKGLTQYQ